MCTRVYTLIAVLLAAPTVGVAAVGDVSFSVTDKTLNRASGSLETNLDIVLGVEGGGSVSATAWGVVITVTPLPGAIGSLTFNPDAIVNNAPNLDPAGTNPYLDFDRDSGGMSFGEASGGGLTLDAFGFYQPPQIGPPPPLDTNGNLIVPDGSGLASLPLVASSDALGDFLLTIDPDPVVTGVVFATGLPFPDDVAAHPVGVHTGAVVTVINLPGDANGDGSVDLLDLDILGLNFGLSTGAAYEQGDFNLDGAVDLLDLDILGLNFGQSVAAVAAPEPTGAVLLLCGLAFVSRGRAAAVRRCTIGKSEGRASNLPLLAEGVNTTAS